jgi:hypothetical protein
MPMETRRNQRSEAEDDRTEHDLSSELTDRDPSRIRA